MDDLQTLLVLYGAWLVFFNVLLEQAGLPIPAYPLLVVSGALAAQGELSWAWVLVSTVLACLIADTGWYAAGQRYGAGLLNTVCRISISPDSCIRQTQKRYLQVGPRLLLIAKFLPGAGALSTVMAGFMGTPYSRFLGYDVAGSLIWSGSAVLIGAIFHRLVSEILTAIDRYTQTGLLFLAVILGVYVLFRILQRRLLLKRLTGIPRLPAEELMAWHRQGKKALLLDVRTMALDPIPGAIQVDIHAPLDGLPAENPAEPIVIYCSCPNEVSAALLALRLRAAGYTGIWALSGGYEAWQNLQRPTGGPAAGQPDEPEQA